MHSQYEDIGSQQSIAAYNGPVVQLVRIHACHAWGREFESRPDRFYSFEVLKYFGLVVQLVRIHACHAWGREFESRPDRFYKNFYNTKYTKVW